MSWRRTTIAGVGAGTLLLGAVAAAAGPVTVDPAGVQVSRGSVSIQRTVATDGIHYSVAFTGPLTVHGWSHTGRLSGSSLATGYQTSDNNIPEFSASTGDGVVTGDCAATQESYAEHVTGTSDLVGNPGQTPYLFDCVLSHNGGSTWQVYLDTSSSQRTSSPGTTTYSGTYRLVDAELASVISTSKNVTYGDAQASEYTDLGGGWAWGPMRLYGQIGIGSGRYFGDIVSDTGPYQYTAGFPTLSVSGARDGHYVTGRCGATNGDVISTQLGGLSLTCQLSLDGGPLVTVPLRVVWTTTGGRGGYKQGYSDFAGYFVAGKV